jgi:hypothetical protein
LSQFVAGGVKCLRGILKEITSVVRKAILPIDPRLLHVKNAEFADDNTWRNISFLSRPPKQLCCKIKG